MILDGLLLEWMNIEWAVDPFPQVTIRKQVPAQECHQIGERPLELGLELKVLDQQHGNQCCPNLDAEGILTGPHEGLDLQILLQSLEEEFDLPPVPVNCR